MAPQGIEDAARRGYHVQTTPLGASNDILREQVNAFHRGKAASGVTGTRLSLQRGLYLARDKADAAEKIALAHAYYARFDNVFGGPGIVENGIIKALPRKQTIEELGANILICGADEMIDRCLLYTSRCV